MKYLVFIPFAALLILAAGISGCDREGGSTNDGGVTEQQKPISPAKPSE